MSEERSSRKDGAERVVSTRAPEPVGAFPHARRVGSQLFLSGIGPRKRGAREIPGVIRVENAMQAPPVASSPADGD